MAQRRTKDSYLRKNYGICEIVHANMWLAQDGRCAICAEPLKMGRGGHAVDHNHTTTKVRSLLCAPCNTSLGLMRESPARLRAAAAYIERHNGRHQQHPSV